MAVVRPKLKWMRGKTYYLGLSHSSMAPHPIRFTADSGVSEYTHGVTVVGTQGQPGAIVYWNIPDSAPNNMMYYCTVHGIGMGNKITVIRDPATIIAWGGDRGVFGSGSNTINGVMNNVQDYIDISTTGNAVDFGDMLEPKMDYAAASSQTRGLFVAGETGVPGQTPISNSNSIEYITFATLNSSTNFGDYYPPSGGGTWESNHTGTSNGTIGVFFGGYDGTNGAPDYGARRNIRYITIDTLSNGVDFGLMTSYRRNAAAVADATRAVVVGGETQTGGQAYATDTMEYVTIATPGNASNFGNLLNTGKAESQGSGDKTRGMIMGGRGGSSVDTEIEYITIQTTGNSVDFGDLLTNRLYCGVTSNGLRSVIAGGSGDVDPMNSMEYITIQTPGNSQDFGDLTVGRTRGVQGVSGNAA